MTGACAEVCSYITACDHLLYRRNDLVQSCTVATVNGGYGQPL